MALLSLTRSYFKTTIRPTPATAPRLMPRRRRYFDPVLLGRGHDLFDDERLWRTNREGRRTRSRVLWVTTLRRSSWTIRGCEKASVMFFLHADRARTAGRHLPHPWRLVPKLLERRPYGTGMYFDAVAQIEMASWSAGRAVLVGDACWCVSPLAGQGASLAVAGAYVLAEELGAAPADVTVLWPGTREDSSLP